MTEIQDYCEDCGRQDMHLREGLCASCLAKYGDLPLQPSHDINHGEHACNDVPSPIAIERYLGLAKSIVSLEHQLAWREAFGIEVAA